MPRWRSTFGATTFGAEWNCCADLWRILEANNVTTQEQLKAWAERTKFADFQGKVKGMGFAIFNWLVMRQGVETIKPDVWVHRFIKETIGHSLSDQAAVAVLEQIAPRIGLKAYELDWRIWESQRSQSPAASPTPMPNSVPTKPVTTTSTGVAEFTNDDTLYRQWLTDNPHGFVINTNKGISSSYMVLHKATCSMVSKYKSNTPPGAFTKRDYVKVCAGDVDSLKEWAKVHGRSDGSFSGACGICKPF